MPKYGHAGGPRGEVLVPLGAGCQVDQDEGCGCYDDERTTGEELKLHLVWVSVSCNDTIMHNIKDVFPSKWLFFNKHLLIIGESQRCHSLLIYCQ